ALEVDANHQGALVGLARLLIAGNRDAEAEPLLEQAGTAGDLGAEVEQMRAVLYLRQKGREYGSEAEARQRGEAEPDNAGRRLELGWVLGGQGGSQEALDMLLWAAQRDRKLAATLVREVMVKVFHAVGVRSPLADEYRDKLPRLLY